MCDVNSCHDTPSLTLLLALGCPMLGNYVRSVISRISCEQIKIFSFHNWKLELKFNLTIGMIITKDTSWFLCCHGSMKERKCKVLPCMHLASHRLWSDVWRWNVVRVAHNKTESELSEIRLHFNIGIKMEKWGMLCWWKQNEQNLK